MHNVMLCAGQGVRRQGSPMPRRQAVLRGARTLQGQREKGMPSVHPSHPLPGFWRTLSTSSGERSPTFPPTHATTCFQGRPQKRSCQSPARGGASACSASARRAALRAPPCRAASQRWVPVGGCARGESRGCVCELRLGTPALAAVTQGGITPEHGRGGGDGRAALRRGWRRTRGRAAAPSSAARVPPVRLEPDPWPPPLSASVRTLAPSTPPCVPSPPLPPTPACPPLLPSFSRWRRAPGSRSCPPLLLRWRA